MEIDASGDIYVTGTAFNFTEKIGHIKLRGSDGQLLWQAYDSDGSTTMQMGSSSMASAESSLPARAILHGDISNSNDDYFTVKRDATSGALLWTHAYGDPCVGCYDASTDVRVHLAWMSSSSARLLRLRSSPISFFSFSTPGPGRRSTAAQLWAAGARWFPAAHCASTPPSISTTATM